MKTTAVQSLLVLMVLLVSGCTTVISEDEARKLVNPIIASVAAYREEMRHYPKSLMKIENFPYKVKPLPSSVGGYYFLEEKKNETLSLYAGGYESGLDPESGYVYHVRMSFAKNRTPRSITSVFVGFKEDGSYEISFARMPPPFKQ